MALRDWLRPRQAAAAAPVAPVHAAVQSASGGILITNPAELDAYLRGGGDTASGQIVTPESALKMAAVFACVKLISGAVATMPLDIKRRVSEHERADASDHPLYRVLRRRPNRWQKPAQFRRMLQAQLLLRGNAYARIVRGVGGRVLELLPLHPDRVSVVQLQDMSLLYTYIRPDGVKQEIPQREIFHLVGMTLDGINGVSVITHARETIGLSLDTINHGSNFFRNGTQVGSKLKHPGKLGKEGIEFVKASLDQFRSGGEREGGTIVLEEGADYEPIGMTMEDASFIETLKFARSDIGMFFGVPPHMIGDTEKDSSWGTGIEQQGLGFVRYTLEDWLTTWQEAINSDLIDEDDIYSTFNRASLVRGDLKTRGAYYNIAVGGPWMTANEARALEDMNPIEGGDERYPAKGVAGPAEGDGNDNSNAAGN